MIEKRYNQRRKTANSILVVARHGSMRSIGRILNVSAGGGACLSLPNFPITVGTRFEICFAIPINNGNIYKLHFRSAVVIHITNGTMGVVNGNIERKLINAAA